MTSGVQCGRDDLESTGRNQAGPKEITGDWDPMLIKPVPTIRASSVRAAKVQSRWAN